MSRPRNAALARVCALLIDVTEALDDLGEVPAEQLSALIYQLATVETSLAARIIRALQIAQESTPSTGDRLLTVSEAAGRLATSKDWLYRHHPRLPFAIHNGRQLRFSAEGIDRYIRQRAGRERTLLPPARER